MQLHHIGYVVDDINKGIAAYQPLTSSEAKKNPEIFHIQDQKVKVCFLDLGNGTFLELVEPAEDNKPLRKMKKKGIGYYHLGFLVADIQKKIEELETAGYHRLNLFSSEAFQGRLCAFLLSPDLQLVELIERF